MCRVVVVNSSYIPYLVKLVLLIINVIFIYLY